MFSNLRETNCFKRTSFIIIEGEGKHMALQKIYLSWNQNPFGHEAEYLDIIVRAHKQVWSGQRVHSI